MIRDGGYSCRFDIGTSFVLGAFRSWGGIVALVSLRAMAAAQPCASQWDPDFGQPGMDSRVRAMAVFDDGSGPGLYAGGQFETVGGQMAAGSDASLPASPRSVAP